MSYVSDNWSDIVHRAWQHAVLAGLPLLIGLAIALPLGWWARRSTRLRPFLIGGAGLLYTIPSLALLIVMPVILGTKILSPWNVIVAMTLYTLALLVRTVADGLSAVPGDVEQAATAMGYTPVKRFFGVDLPLAIPVIAGGLRVAAVSNVSIVSVASLLGVSQLGYYITNGYQRSYSIEVWVGIIGCLVLALLFDLIIQLVSRALTPWLRVRGAS
ncbi:ABC transporter permease [Flexivirga meconopsidis]|uniref:ABC transporter permease n=1 Tax=Flexivirga meconopsidis TaxID=2977121 RepID=UPI002240BAB8|nr:ABC transporter permease [Flexivirga meconopsidis]